MAVCAQASFSQRATWPPSATVRQRSMALITFNWSRLTCLRLASRQAGPWSRKISATSRVGRPTSAAVTPPVRAYASSLAAGACRQAARADSRWRRSDLWPHVCSAPSCPAWNAQAEPGSAEYRCRSRADAWQSCGAANGGCERLHEEFKRRIKTQTVLPSAETAAMLFWALLAAGQITMRKVDGWQTLTDKLAHKPIDLAA